ncbi:hypothetical protein KIPB_013533, partial [Kipferlia bialata]
YVSTLQTMAQRAEARTLVMPLETDVQGEIARILK